MLIKKFITQTKYQKLGLKKLKIKNEKIENVTYENCTNEIKKIEKENLFIKYIFFIYF